MAFPSVKRVGDLLNIGAGPLFVGTFLIWIAYRKRSEIYWQFVFPPAPSAPVPEAIGAPSVTANAPGLPVTNERDPPSGRNGVAPVPILIPAAPGEAVNSASPGTPGYMLDKILGSLSASAAGHP